MISRARARARGGAESARQRTRVTWSRGGRSAKGSERLVYCIWADYARKYFTGKGDDSSGGETATENGDARRRGRAREGERETGIYACEAERPLYVVDAIIYDTYRSQLRVMALTLVFMAILFLVAFHARRPAPRPLRPL